MKTCLLIIACLYILSGCQNKATSGDESSWSLVLHQDGKADMEVVALPGDLSKPFSMKRTIDGVLVQLELEPKGTYAAFKASARTETQEDKAVFFSLQKKYSDATPYNFNGEVKTPEIFRQSPHDVNAWIVTNIARQAVPMVALKRGSSFIVALNGTPALYNNFTSQTFLTEQNIIALSSGDNGNTPGLRPDTVKQIDIEYNTEKTQIMAPGKILPYYHPISDDREHIFEGIIFESKARNLNGLRKDVNQYAALHFSGGKFNDYFGALAFTTAYMNLRVNETSKSKFWVVPSVEYGNTQYGRDAFWISTMLEPEYAAECMKNELDAVNSYAEYPLFAVIWAYRAWKEKNEIDLAKVQAYIDAIETRAKEGYFYSYLESDGRLDFQYWGDVIAFEKDDVITYNQGLFALAMLAANELGLKTKTDPAPCIAELPTDVQSCIWFLSHQ